MLMKIRALTQEDMPSVLALLYAD